MAGAANAAVARLLALIVLIRLQRERADDGRAAVTDRAAGELAHFVAAEQQAQQTARNGAAGETLGATHLVESVSDLPAGRPCISGHVGTEHLLEKLFRIDHVTYLRSKVCGIRRRPRGEVRECGRLRPARRPVEQLDGVHDRNAGGGRELRDAADVAGSDDGRARARDMTDLAIAQALRELGLKNVVGTRRAAAEMPFRDLRELVAGRREQRPRRPLDFLAVLHRAGGVIGDGQIARACYCGRQAELGQQLRDVAGLGAHGGRFCRELRVVAKHVAEILDVRAATRRVGHDRIEPLPVHLAMQLLD